jgi:hypothetical protein
MSISDYLLVIGLGFLWHGVQIIWVGGLPRQLRSAAKGVAKKGSAKSFMLFWLDQYSWIGIGLSFLGAGSILIGVIK